MGVKIMSFDKKIVEISNLDSDIFTYPGVYYTGSIDNGTQEQKTPDSGGCSGCGSGGVNLACCCCPCCCCWGH